MGPCESILDRWWSMWAISESILVLWELILALRAILGYWVSILGLWDLICRPLGVDFMFWESIWDSGCRYLTADSRFWISAIQFWSLGVNFMSITWNCTDSEGTQRFYNFQRACAARPERVQRGFGVISGACVCVCVWIVCSEVSVCCEI